MEDSIEIEGQEDTTFEKENREDEEYVEKEQEESKETEHTNLIEEVSLDVELHEEMDDVVGESSLPKLVSSV